MRNTTYITRRNPTPIQNWTASVRQPAPTTQHTDRMARDRKGKACSACPSSLRLQPKLYGRGSRTLPNKTDVIPFLDCVHSLHSIQYTRHIQLVSYMLTWTRCHITSPVNKNSRSKEITLLDTAKGNIYVHSWFQTFAVLWMLYYFFWVIPWRLNCMTPDRGITPQKRIQHICTYWSK
jgi:hypothetical protein